MNRLSAIRGAVTAENTKESIQVQTVKLVKEIIEARDYVFFVLVFVEFLLALSLVVNFIIDPVRKKRRNQDYKFNKLGIIFTSFFCIFVLIQFIPMLIVIFIYFFGST